MLSVYQQIIILFEDPFHILPSHGTEHIKDLGLNILRRDRKHILCGDLRMITDISQNLFIFPSKLVIICSYTVYQQLKGASVCFFPCLGKAFGKPADHISVGICTALNDRPFFFDQLINLFIFSSCLFKERKTGRIRKFL